MSALIQKNIRLSYSMYEMEFALPHLRSELGTSELDYVYCTVKKTQPWAYAIS